MKSAFQGHLAILLLAAAHSLSPLPTHAAELPKTAPNGKPWNILLIILDDLNDYPSGFANYPGVKTPNFDKLAASGMRFPRAVCPGTMCMPSRTAFLSGLAPYRSGIYQNGQKWTDSEPLRHVRTLPQLFRESGWYTVGRGKIFHDKPPNMADLWDEPWEGGGYAPVPKPGLIPDSIRRSASSHQNCGVTTEDRVPDFRLVAASAQRLGQPFTNRFFFAHGIYYPHNPWTVPQRFLDLYPEDKLAFPPPGWKEGDLDDLSETAKKIADAPWDFQATKEAGFWKPVLRHYLACVSAADELVGQLLTALDNSPHKDNTIVIVCGDNGFHLGEKNHFAKYTLWRQTAYVPFVIRVPGMTKPGAVCERPVSLQDLYPTLVELCGLPDPGHVLDGRSLVPLLQQPDRDWPYPALTTHPPGAYAARTERYAYLRYADNAEELYDLAHDPQEWTNQTGNPGFTPIKAELAKALPDKAITPAGKGQGGKKQSAEDKP